jgi:hypothetical protein
VPSDGRVLQVLDLCMPVGEVLLPSGEPVGETSATMMRLAEACGRAGQYRHRHHLHLDTLCAHHGQAVAPVSSTRLVRYRQLPPLAVASAHHRPTTPPPPAVVAGGIGRA